MRQTSARALLPQPRVLSPGEGVSTWKLPLCIRGAADALVASNAHPDIVDEAASWFRDLGVAACKADAMCEAGSQGGTHGVVTMELLDDDSFKQLPAVQQALTSAPHPPQGALLQQAYSADIDAHGCATVHATSRRGLFYGVQTLVQWLVVHNRDFVQTIRAFGGGDDGDGALHADVSARESKHGATDEAVSLACPSAVVVDWPDILHRGVMLDVSRDRVWTMATLRATVRRLVHMKVNQLQLYMEHTFQYHDHREVWYGSGAYSAHDIKSLDAFCAKRFIRLVPNQQSFGHMSRWLSKPTYAPLAECPDGFPHPFARDPEPFTLCPTDPRALALAKSLHAELASCFRDDEINVGLDETFDLGKGRSRSECRSRGIQHVYLDYLLNVHKYIAGMGKRMQYWGDIVLHHPDIIGKLPRDATALIWGYEGDHPFDAQCQLFASHRIPFYVVPGTSSWNSIGGRTTAAIANLRSAALAGRQHGAIGFLNADWGDNGHLQTLTSAFLGLAVGADVSWNPDADTSRERVVHVLGTHVLREREPRRGHAAALYDLGNTYRQVSSSDVYTRAFNLNGTLMYYLMLVPEALLAFALRKLVGMALHDRPCCRRVVGVAASRFGLGLLLALLFAVCVGLPLFAVGVFRGAVSMAGAFAMALAVGALLFVPTAYMVLGHALLCCGRVTSRGWRRARDHVERVLDNPRVVAASGADMAVADADTIAQEVLWTAQLLGWMVRYAQLRTSMGLGHVGCASRRRRSGFARDLAKLASRHRELWTRRCRREGVDSSAARFDLTVCVLEGGRYDSSATHGLQVAVGDDGPSDASTPLSASAVRRGGCTERARACGGPVVGATCCCCWCGQSCC